MNAAHEQPKDINFAAVNWLHVPVALASMLFVAALFARGIWRRRFDDLTLLAATASFALLGNAVICGVISGPHDRYDARLVWIATFTALTALSRLFGDAEEVDEDLRGDPDRHGRLNEEWVPVSVATNAKHLRANHAPREDGRVG